MEIISRKDAKVLGLKRYYTGKACPNGHMAERYVSGSGCSSCVKERSKHSKNKKSFKEYTREYNKKYKNNLSKSNPHYVTQSAELYYTMHKKEILKRQKEYRNKNKNEINAKARERHRLAKQEKNPT